MTYPEIVRTRAALYWFCGVVASAVLLEALVLALHHFYPEHVILDSGQPGPWKLPAALAFPLAGFLTMTLATVYGVSMSRFRDNAELIVTFPVTRERFAASVYSVDILALACSFAFVLVVSAVGVTLLGIWPHVDFGGDDPVWAFKSFGAVVMFYALLQAVSAWVPGRGGLVLGLSWPLIIVLESLTQITHPAWIAAIFDFLTYFNPITYLGSTVSKGAMHAALPLPLLAQAFLSWIIALAALAIAVAGYKRREF
jgi:hypothetical protein